MAEDCVFCGIVGGDIPARDVYETDEVLAFLDANPLARGHTLVVPKDHSERIRDLTPETACAIGEALATLAPAAESAVDATGSTVAFNNGEAAGQEIPHVHAHIVPRTHGDGAGAVHSLFTNPPSVSDEELDEVAAHIAESVEA